MKKTAWDVSGMTCSNCALSVTKYLQGKGMQEVSVNPLDGHVVFVNSNETAESELKKGIQQLGYLVHEEQANTDEIKKTSSLNQKRFYQTLPFTLILMLHMLHPWFHIHWLMNGWVQLFLCLPVLS